VKASVQDRRNAQNAADVRPESELSLRLVRDLPNDGDYVVIVGTRWLGVIPADEVATLRAQSDGLPATEHKPLDLL